MVERQECVESLPLARLRLAALQKEYDDHKLQYVKIGERNAMAWEKRGKKGAPQLSVTEEASKVNVENNLKKNKIDIETLEKQIAELEATIAKVD
jgi:hypothetical protein